MTPEKLARDLQGARQAGLLAASGVADKGSCSADCVFIPVGKDYPIKRFSKKWDDAVGGWRSTNNWWHGYMMIPPNVGGQANKRLVACEKMADHLRNCGWHALVFSQMD